MSNNESTNDKTDASNDTQNNQTSDPNNNECETTKTLATQKTDSVRKIKQDEQDLDLEQDRKLFIGYGANQLITEIVLEEFFRQFGEIEKVIIKRDVVTTKPRGFAFITMAKAEYVWKVLDACPLKIKGRQIDVKLAKSRPISKKVFVGGIDPNLTKEDIIKVFSQFGKVVEVELPFDRLKRKRREFCFVIFETEDAANRASENPKQIIYDRECDVKKATPQPIAQQLKRDQQNLHHSFNSAAYSQHSNQYYSVPNNSSLNHSKSYAKPLFASPNSTKSGSGSYRGGYRGKNPMNRNHSSMNNGRRSVDSQYNTIHEFSIGSNNTSFNGRKNINQHHQNQNRQYISNSVPNVSAANANNANEPFNQQLNKPQIQLTNQQQQLYYEQLAQQGYYGYQSMPYNDYYAAQPLYNPGQPTTTGQQSTNAANNQFLAYPPNHLDYYNQYANQFYQNQPTQQAIQQYANSINQCYTNYQSANQMGSGDNNLHTQQPPQPPQTSTEQNYQSLEDRYYSEQQKQIESNLMSNFDEKYDGQDIVNNYQPQLINNNNLLNLPYQGSIQQC